MNTQKKLKLYGIGNTDKFNYYEFDKKYIVLKALEKIFRKVFKIQIILYNEKQDRYGKWHSEKINLKKNIDTHYGYENGKVRIDIFYGIKKMFVTIICSQKLRTKFNEALGEVSEMPEETIIKSKRRKRIKK